MSKHPTLISLPGQPSTWIDPMSVVCVRAVPSDGIVAVHTSEGFAVGVTPESDEQTLAVLASHVLDAIDAALDAVD